MGLIMPWFGAQGPVTTSQSHENITYLQLNCYFLNTQSHKDEVHALAVHPSETQFISASLDHSVSLWDAETHQVIWTVKVEVRAIRTALDAITNSLTDQLTDQQTDRSTHQLTNQLTK